MVASTSHHINIGDTRIHAVERGDGYPLDEQITDCEERTAGGINTVRDFLKRHMV